MWQHRDTFVGGGFGCVCGTRIVTDMENGTRALKRVAHNDCGFCRTPTFKAELRGTRARVDAALALGTALLDTLVTRYAIMQVRAVGKCETCRGLQSAERAVYVEMSYLEKRRNFFDAEGATLSEFLSHETRVGKKGRTVGSRDWNKSSISTAVFVGYLARKGAAGRDQRAGKDET